FNDHSHFGGLDQQIDFSDRSVEEADQHEAPKKKAIKQNFCLIACKVKTSGLHTRIPKLRFREILDSLACIPYILPQHHTHTHTHTHMYPTSSFILPERTSLIYFDTLSNAYIFRKYQNDSIRTRMWSHVFFKDRLGAVVEFAVYTGRFYSRLL